ncbi:MAG: aminopeptidase [Thermoanaerobaculia bacterium]
MSEEIHIHGGGNDLRVGLSGRARWRSCGWQTVGGQSFRANLPSEEVFTTPDRRLTHGRLAASKPFRTPDGELVKDLVVSFRQGRVETFDASEGKQAFASWLDAEEDARFLGELALVGRDSAIARCGLYFDKTLLDENAGAHVALGQGFPLALAGGEVMSKRELERQGCNLSGTHTDVTFGSARVSVVATRSRRGKVVLLDCGRWIEPFGLQSREGPDLHSREPLTAAGSISNSGSSTASVQGS